MTRTRSLHGRHVVAFAAGVAACQSLSWMPVNAAEPPPVPSSSAEEAPDAALLEFLSLFGDAEPGTLDLLFADVPLRRREADRRRGNGRDPEAPPVDSPTRRTP